MNEALNREVATAIQGSTETERIGQIISTIIARIGNPTVEIRDGSGVLASHTWPSSLSAGDTGFRLPATTPSGTNTGIDPATVGLTATVRSASGIYVLSTSSVGDAQTDDVVIPEAFANGETVPFAVVGLIEPVSNLGAAPTPAPPPAPTPTLNTVDTIISDMTGNNDLTILGVVDNQGNPFRWQLNPTPAQIGHGARARGSAAPQWWLNSGDVPAEFKDDDLWNAFTQWFVLFEGQGNSSDNVRIEARNCYAYYLSKATGNWVKIDEIAQATAYRVTKNALQWAGTLSSEDLVQVTDGPTSVRVRPSQAYITHGEWDPRDVPEDPIRASIAAFADDIDAIFVTLEARMVKHDSNISGSLASTAIWGLQSGADYWPELDTQIEVLGANAGVGLSRTKRILETWQPFNFCTIEGPRIDGTAIPTDLYITQQQLRDNPPPLDGS